MLIIIIIITVGKLLKASWEDEEVDQEGCFAWVKEWRDAPTHTIAGIVEMYEQQVPTRLYSARKTHTSPDDDIMCRLCGKVAESMAHVLAGCSALAQNKYMVRHNAALQLLSMRS
jgi:hypothetical protein